MRGGADIETESLLWETLNEMNYSVLGIAVGDVAKIEDVKAAVSEARRASRNRDLVIGLGGPAVSAHFDLFDAVGADFAATSAMLAVDFANKLSKTSARQRG